MRILLAVLLAAAPVSQAMAQDAPTAEQQADISKVVDLLRSGKAADAIDILDPMLDGYEKTYAGEKGMIFCATGAQDAVREAGIAQAAGRDAIMIDYGWCFALWAKGYALVDLHRIAEGLPYLERAAAMMPFNAQYLAELGNAYQELHQWDKAVATFKRAVDASQGLTGQTRMVILGRSLRGVGFSLIELKQWDEAEDWFNKALALNPNDEAAKSELAYIAQKRPKR